MIRISQIDSEFSIYKDNIVVLFGLGNGFKQMVDLLRYHNIDIDFVCDINKQNWGEIRQGIPVISPKHLEYLVVNSYKKKVEGDIIVQISDNNINHSIIEKINSFGIDKIISFSEAITMLKLLSFLSLYQSDPLNPFFSHNKNNNANKKIQVHYILKTENLLPIFISHTQKTGDMTLKNTLQSNNIPCYFTSHNPNFLDKELCKDKTIKITTAVRDPIAKLLSNTYQDLDPNSFIYSYEKLKNHYNFFENGGDAQLLFDLIIKRSNSSSHLNVSVFMDKFKESIIDLSKYPFDKEKGYAIIKEDNIEVFVYQLEKMNDVVKEMSDWIGQTPFDEWVMANEASNKWIANSYNQAKKEITFSQEYFDKCYDNPWIKHFYSQDDIEKFRERWRPHIK